jgi:hypothetical protein
MSREARWIAAGLAIALALGAVIGSAVAVLALATPDRIDPHQLAPGERPRFYVGVGMPGSATALDDAILDGAREHIEERVDGIEGVVLADDGLDAAAVERELRDRSLVGYYVDSSIVGVETLPDGATRARVSVMVQTYPERNLRSMLSGAATVRGPTGAVAQRAAIEAALDGALRNLGAAMTAPAQ